MASITALNRELRELRELRRKNTALKSKISSLEEELTRTGRYPLRDVWLRVGFIEVVIIIIICMIFYITRL